MSSDYAAQREALVDLSVAYEGARDITRPVLCTAFGNVALGSVPPPSECVWPPDITQAEANSRLRAVQHFLAQTEAVFKKVLRDIEVALDRLVASGFDVPRSWIITDPLYSIRGWYLGACGVEEIVRNAASEDSALQTAVEDIAKDVKVYLKCKIAKSNQAGGNGQSPEADPADSQLAKRKRRGRGPRVIYDPQEDAKLVRDWQAAKRQGNDRKQFCRNRGTNLKDLTKAQGRVRERRLRV